VSRLFRAFVLAVSMCVALGVAAGAAARTDDDDNDRLRVKMRDECDPVTFNAAIGPGTCVGDGTVTFSEFIAELAATQQVTTWRFAPRRASVERGERIVAKNVGGEVHTFTEVAEFGPGIVPELNELVFGVPGPPLPEFLQLEPSDFIAPGGKVTLRTGKHGLRPGRHRFECAIHPWMKATIRVTRDDD
jgi:plastocyanin